MILESFSWAPVVKFDLINYVKFIKANNYNQKFHYFKAGGQTHSYAYKSYVYLQVLKILPNDKGW